MIVRDLNLHNAKPSRVPGVKPSSPKVAKVEVDAFEGIGGQYTGDSH